MSNSLRLHGLYGSWNSPGQNTGVGSLSLLRGIFATQGSNTGLLHCRQILYQLSYLGSPRITKSPSLSRNYACLLSIVLLVNRVELAFQCIEQIKKFEIDITIDLSLNGIRPLLLLLLLSRFSRVRLLATPWTAAHQTSPPMGFCRQEYWSGLPLTSPIRPLQPPNFCFRGGNRRESSPFPTWSNCMPATLELGCFLRSKVFLTAIPKTKRSSLEGSYMQSVPTSADA